MKKYAGPYVLSCKLDGVSGLYVMEKGGAKLYTRGDGVVGQDITHLLRALKLPVIPVGVAIRGEFILPKRLFEEKYRGTFANPRNLVSGIINAKKVDEKASDLHFVAYEVISPEMIPSEQMAKIVEWKLEVVRNESRGALTNEELSAVLLDWRANYEYEIDGVIVCDDHIYPRVSGNPDHAFAFKMVLSEQMAECKVVDVIWTPSKNGYLKPRVRIEPVSLGGVTIEYATGFNGKFIEENKIGVGAMIQMIRSGDVIPYIKGVVVPAEVAKMPAVGYEWTDTGVDIVLTNKLEDVTVREKNVAGFFVGLEVDGLSIGNIRRLFKGGFDTVGKILRMSVADFESVEGFQKKMAEKIFGGIREKVGAASLLDVMVASNQMGRGLGEKKLAPIMEAFPDILVLEESDTAKVAKLMTVRGIGRENAAEFVANIRGFLAFLRDCGLEGKLVSTGAVGVIDKYSTAPSAALDTGHPLYGKKIVMTKIRDKEIIDRLPGLGAKLEDSMKKDVFALVVKSHADVSNKVDFAKKNGIPVFTPEEFKARFFV
jgi:NAD-dependent DNA ligase